MMNPPDQVHPYEAPIDIPKGGLVTRRGSISAPDPFAQNVEADKPRHVRSRLTVVRIPDDGQKAAATELTSSHRVNHLFTDPGLTRLSFSASSFSSQDATRSRRHTIPPRRASLTQRHPVRRPSLTPQQICDMASNALAARDLPVTASVFRRVPASFYLPFLHRAEEVTNLLSTPANARLMVLVSLTFPSCNRDDVGEFTKDSTKWSFATLMKYMTTVDRCDANDLEWLSNARKCIRFHNEAMWERVKSVLGVLPEVDVDDPVVDSSSEYNEHGGTKASFWVTDSELHDAWLEPMFPQKSVRLEAMRSSPSAGGMTTIGEEEEESLVETVDAAEAGTKASQLPEETNLGQESEYDLGSDATPLKNISALRVSTGFLYLPGSASRDIKVESLSPDPYSQSNPGAPSHVLATGDTQHSLRETQSQPEDPKNGNENGRQEPPLSLNSVISGLLQPSHISRWTDHNLVESPTSSSESTSPVINVPPKRRHPVRITPRFPTTFAQLSSIHSTALSERVVHAGTVH